MFSFDKARLIGLLPPGFSESRSVRFQDVDAAGIVFYPRIIEYCHDVYVSFLGAHGQPLDQVLRERTWAAPIRHSQADFLKPLSFGQQVDVSLVLAHLESTEATLAFQLTLAGSVLAIVQSVHAFVSVEGFRRIPIPEPVRQLLGSLPQG